MNASDSTVISTTRLTRLCGLRETRLRELAEEGWIPKPSRREHALAPTIAGLFRYYRDHEEKQNVQDVYESFEECSAAVGIPVKVLKRAKRKGYPALRHNRVHLLAPSLTGQPLATIEERLKDEEQGIIAQLQILDDRLREWEASGGS